MRLRMIMIMVLNSIINTNQNNPPGKVSNQDQINVRCSTITKEGQSSDNKQRQHLYPKAKLQQTSFKHGLPSSLPPRTSRLQYLLGVNEAKTLGACPNLAYT